MKPYNLPTLLLILVTFISGCNMNKNTNTFNKPEKLIYSPEYAVNFEISGYDGNENTLITTKNPWQGAENIESKIFISRDNTSPEGFNGQVLKKEPQRIVCMSSTHIALLDALGETDRIVGVSGLPFISNDKIRNNSDKIADIGFEGNIDYEKLASLKPDIVLLYSVSGVSMMEGKLKELGIPFMYLGEYLENHPLGKAEWIVAMAELIGEREKGEAAIKKIVAGYNDVKNRLTNIKPPYPKIMLNTPYEDSWFMPSTESYIATLIKDAGGDYIYKKNKDVSPKPIDLEEAFVLTSQADYWINLGSFNSLRELKTALPKFADLKCLKEENIYNDNFRQTSGGGNDCYESGIVNPDLMLRDLIKIFHPELIEEDFTYYHQLR